MDMEGFSHELIIVITPIDALLHYRGINILSNEHPLLHRGIIHLSQICSFFCSMA